MKLMQKQRKKERKIRFSVLQNLFNLSAEWFIQQLRETFPLHCTTFVYVDKWWGKYIELYQYTYWRKRKCEQLHYKLYCDFMVAALCLVFRCKLLISCRHFSYVWLSFWWLSSLPVGSYGFIEACVLFWQSCKKKEAGKSKWETWTQKTITWNAPRLIDPS